MQTSLEKYLSGRENLSVADLGSKAVSFQPGYTYRDLMRPSWRYTGIDLEPGDNVDVVMTGEYSIPIPDGAMDVLISGQCLEHCRNPFRLMSEVARIVKLGGLVFATAPACWPEHRFPLDCFRFYPDGMRSVMEEAGLDVLEAFLGGDPRRRRQEPVGIDCWGIARKP